MENGAKIIAVLAACSFCLLASLLSCSDKAAEPKPPTLALEPAFLSPKAPFGGSSPLPKWIQVRNKGEGTLTFSATKSASWMSLYQATGTAPDSFLVYFGIAGLTEGVYVDTIWVTSPEAANSPQIVEVILTIAPLMEISPQVLSFLALKSGDNPEPQQFTVTSTSGAGFSYTISESASWLSVSPESGVAPDTITINVDITGLPPDIYTEIIMIDAPQAANTPQGVLCTLTVSSWREQQNEVQKDLRGVTFVDESHGWAVGIVGSVPEITGYILATTDGGQHWAVQSLEIDEALGDVVFVDANTGWAVGAKGTILHTTDGGANWIAQTSDITKDLAGVAFVGADTGWAVGRDGVVLHTADGGINWVQQHSDTMRDLSQVVFVDSRHGWAVGNRGTIIHTDDGGNHWGEQESGTSFDLRDLYFTDRETGWVVGASGNVLHTTDSGNTWTAQPTNTSKQLSGLTFSNTGHGWAVGIDGTILHTADGSNWSLQPSGTTRWLFDVYFFNDNIGWAVGAEGIIIHTVSGGN